MTLKSVKLTNSSHVATIDKEDYPLISKYDWRLHKHGYAVTSIYSPETQKQSVVTMHKMLCNWDLVDHIDRNKLNNSRSNLRKATPSQNMINREKFQGEYTSKYKGVYYNKNQNKWVASISINNVQIKLGQFETEDQAGLMYNIKAKELHKEFAVLNEVPLETKLPPKYRGVSYDSKRDVYVARLRVKGEQVLYKRCNTKREALDIRNEYARKYNKLEQKWRG